MRPLSILRAIIYECWGTARSTRTSGKRAIPGPQILSGLWHLNVRIELFDLIHDSVLIIILEIKQGLLK